MAKRRAPDDITSASPKKCREVCRLDMRLESVAPPGVRPPSLLALCRSGCRKRPFHCDQPGRTDFDMAHLGKSAHGDPPMKTHDLPTVHRQNSGTGQNPRSATSTNKRARSDRGGPETTHSGDEASVKVDAKKYHEDSSFNTFQFWRVPLPELDMSLLQEPPKKDSSSEEMET